MIKTDTDQKEHKCPDCGENAFRRQVFTVHPEFPLSPGRWVLYDTHAECLTDPAHHAVLGRIESFHLTLNKLIHGLALALQDNNTVQVLIKPGVETNPETDPPIEAVEPIVAVGIIKRVDFYTCKPSACGVRKNVVPEFTISSFGMDAVFVLSGNPQRPGACNRWHHTTEPAEVLKIYPGFDLSSLTVEGVLSAGREACDIPVKLLYRKFITGDHRHGLQIPRTGQAPAA
jgi:hypothetical protein